MASATTVLIDSTDSVDIDTRTLAVNSSGVIFVIYYDGTNLEVKNSTNGGTNWGTPTIIKTDTYLRQPLICVDANDNLHYAWKTGLDDGKHMCYWNANSTMSSENDIRGQGNWMSMVPNDNGTVYIFFGELDEYDNLFVRKWDGDSWDAPVEIIHGESGAIQRCEAAITSNGTVHVVFQWQGSSNVGYAVSTDNGTTWTNETLDADLGGAALPSITVDSYDNLHVIYQGKNSSHTMNQVIYVSHLANGSAWSSEHYLTDISATNHHSPTITVDSDDTIYAIWSDEGGLSGNFRIAMRKSDDLGTTWSSVTECIDMTENSRLPSALHFMYPANNIPYSGFMLTYKEDFGGTPDVTVYMSSDWALTNSFVKSNPYPSDQGYSPLQPQCHVDVNLIGGATFNVSFWENSTGSWVLRQTNSSVTNGTFWWTFTQASSYYTTYYWKVQGNIGGVFDNTTYQFTTLQLVNTTGETITSSDLFKYTDGSIQAKYDLINDSANYTALFPAYRESAGWIRDGGSSITKINGTWYITHRQRTGDTTRGNYVRLDSSTDLISWSIVWNVTKGDVSPKTLNSFERLSLRYYNDTYYLYFCFDDDGTWDVSYVKSSTAEDLENQLLNSNNWTLLLDDAKDPEVHHHNGTYYFSTSKGLYKDDNPEGSSLEFIVDFTQMYISTYGGDSGNPGTNTGTIMFDDTSGYFIYWRTVNVDYDGDENINDILWFFAISGDLDNWEPIDRHVKIKNYTDDAGVLGYPSYFVTSTETVYLSDYEDDEGDYSLYLWVYDTGDEDIAPILSDETPTNETTDVAASPWCSITVADPEGSTFDVTFEENSTGSWVVRLQNLTASNGTFWWQFTQATGSEMDYYWRISADDGANNNTTVYKFTTELNDAPELSSPFPANNSVDASWATWCSITITDDEAGTFDVTFEENSTGSWVVRQQNLTASDGTFWWQFTQATDRWADYYWRVSADDGTTNNTTVYTYTTEPNTHPQVSSPFPSNGTSGIIPNIQVYFTVSDAESDSVDISWLENSTGSWVERKAWTDQELGTFYWDFIQASLPLTTYYWKVNVTDGFNNTTAIYHYTTINPAPQVSLPSPGNGATASLQSTCSILVRHYYGYSMNVTFEEKLNDVWILKQTSSGVGNGTYQWTYTNATLNSTAYYWRVNATDIGGYSTLRTYHFTTPSNTTSGGGHTGGVLTFTILETPYGIQFNPIIPPVTTISSYYWEFGDGTISTSQSPTHYYRNPGDYKVTLSVETSPSGVLSTSQVVHIGDQGLLLNLLNTVQASDDGLIIWLNGERLLYPEAALMVGGCLLTMNAYMSEQEAKRYRKKGHRDAFKSWRQFEMLIGCLMLLSVIYIEVIVKGGLVY